MSPGNRDVSGFLTRYIDLDALLFGRNPLISKPEVSGPVGVFLFPVDVALRADVVCNTPREGLIPAEDDARYAHVTGSRGVNLRSGQMDLEPARHCAERDVRIAGDHRCAARRLVPRDDPVVAAETLFWIAENLTYGDLARSRRLIRASGNDALVLSLTGYEIVQHRPLA